MRILWKYVNKRTRDIHFSWERWERGEAMRMGFGNLEYRRKKNEYRMVIQQLKDIPAVS